MQIRQGLNLMIYVTALVITSFESQDIFIPLRVVPFRSDHSFHLLKSLKHVKLL